MGFRDMTWCSRECGNTKCFRNFTPEQSAKAGKWWGSPGAPVLKQDLKDTKMCEGFAPPSAAKKTG